MSTISKMKNAVKNALYLKRYNSKTVPLRQVVPKQKIQSRKFLGHPVYKLEFEMQSSVRMHNIFFNYLLHIFTLFKKLPT